MFDEVDTINVKDTISYDMASITPTRILRVPEDSTLHNAPSEFGRFPLVEVSKCDPARIPPLMREKGGVLMPMLQREAMCITLSSGIDYNSRKMKPHLFAMRLHAGGVNTISGK